MWKVELADYFGDGHWVDYPPYEFDSESDARKFANRQRDCGTKVRRVYAADAAKEE